MADSIQSCAIRTWSTSSNMPLLVKYDCKALDWVPESALPELAHAANIDLITSWSNKKPHGTFPKCGNSGFVHKTWTVLYSGTNKLNWQQDDVWHPWKIQWMPIACHSCPLQRRRLAQVSLQVATPLELPHLTTITLPNQYSYASSKYSFMFHWAR